MVKLYAAYSLIEKNLNEKSYLLGEQFTAIDAYLFTILRWASHLKIDLINWSNISNYKERVSARPKVQAALFAEGLIKG